MLPDSGRQLPDWGDAARFVEPCWIQPPNGAIPIPAGTFASGWEWRDHLGHWCLLTNVTSGAPAEANATQTQLVLERMESLLDARGLSFRDVVRTWFFLDEILSWYDVFNRVRTGFFEQRQLLGRMPASTAVGPLIEGGPTLLAGLLAVAPKAEFASVYPVPSPAQGSAFDYGSSFSRAMEISWPRGKRLYVSGTASIDAVGRTLYPGDLSRQVGETMRVVNELLGSRGLSFGDVTQGTCYISEDDDGSLSRALAYLPEGASFLEATICRADL